ncbi:hypothetical protein AWJ20_1298 [Sugiyamaella lignohabitans]|uniref:GSKIP domain-containing protein n=1 Tax=Sugiyamaella lignohabitans TaxID=796027 RepID=A0A167DKP9_9ASCO|nr:uncharacterized protein AWJ20_1298 [Sugiyamaella lignohabitans]ANB13020.1 hypothetical protein AWJ20_1298 [Sugiyamaella lignohabitans]
MSLVSNEYDTLIAEYGKFLESVKIEESTVEIVTKEQGKLHVHLTKQGWTILTSTIEHVRQNDIFETSEALLMTASPTFSRLWNEKLFDRLNQLQQDGDS